MTAVRFGGIIAGFMLTLAVVFGGCSSTPEKPDQGPAAQPGGQQPPVTGETASTAGGQTVKRYDLNHDNKPDVWAYFGPLQDPDHPGQVHQGLVRKEWDFNFDGKVDIKRFFNFKGERVKDEMDLDFDGKFDVTSYFRANKKIRQEYDFNFDGKPDFWKYFEKGVVVRTERDRDFNGRVDVWEYFKDGKVDRIGKDEDGDGQIDKWVQQEESE